MRNQMFQSTHSLRSATLPARPWEIIRTQFQSTHSLRSATDMDGLFNIIFGFQSTHSLRSATGQAPVGAEREEVSIHALLAECDWRHFLRRCPGAWSFNPRTPCGVRQTNARAIATRCWFQSTHSLRSATAPDLIHCYSTEQIILCANLPKKTVIARLLFLSIYLSIFYSQCITPIADLPGNSCELEVGAQAMFNSL